MNGDEHKALEILTFRVSEVEASLVELKTFTQDTKTALATQHELLREKLSTMHDDILIQKTLSKSRGRTLDRVWAVLLAILSGGLVAGFLQLYRK